MCKVIVITYQKGGVGKTTRTSLGFTEPDKLEEKLATVMANIINDVEMDDYYGILKHEEGIDLMSGNIELFGLEVSLVNVMSRGLLMRSYFVGAYLFLGLQ